MSIPESNISWCKLAGKVLEILATMPRWPGCPFVVPNPKTLKPYLSFFISWDMVWKKAGMPEVCINDLRHSAASFLINANHSLYVVQKLLGHTQIKTTARYSHLAPETMLNAVDTMADAAGMGVTPVAPAGTSVPPLVPPAVLRLIGKEESKAA